MLWVLPIIRGALDSGGRAYNYMVRTYGASEMVKSGKWNPIKDTVVKN